MSKLLTAVETQLVYRNARFVVKLPVTAMTLEGISGTAKSLV
jgi:hypothetical protein